VTGRRGRRRRKLLGDLKDRRGYSHLKEEVLDRTMWRNRFGGSFGPVVRQNTEWMNEHSYWQTAVLVQKVREVMSELHLFFQMPGTRSFIISDITVLFV